MCENASQSIVWLDLTETPGSTIHFELCKIDPYLDTFRSGDRCIDFITEQNYSEVQMFLVLSLDTSVTCSLLSIYQQLPQVNSIFILSSFEIDYSDFNKIHGIYSDSTSLCEILNKKCTHRRRHRDRFRFQPGSPPDSVTSAGEHTEGETTPSFGIDVDFMCSKFLKEILNQIRTTPQEMVDFLLEECCHSETDLDAIQTFKYYYNAQHAINWYTRDTFLYRLLNAALRTLDIDKLYSMRCFMKDLDTQLVQRFESERLNSTSRIMYRGQLMARTELQDKILSNVGSFYSVPSFFSTTQDRYLAEVFSGDGASIEADSVLFEIEVSQRDNRVAYAEVSRDSAFGEDEQEILFTMGAIFRIISAEETHERTWLVKMKLCDDDDEKTKRLEFRLRNEISSSDGTMSLARLAFRMARYDVAVKFYDSLLQNPPENAEFALRSKIHEELGSVYYAFRQYENAIEHYEASLRIDVEHYPKNDPRFFKRYSDLGCSYLANRDYKDAEAIMNAAMNMIEDLPEPDQTCIEIYVKIVADFFRAKRRDIAITSLKESQNSPVQKFKSFLEKYPNSLSLGNDIGTVYHVQNNYDGAMEMYELCLANQLSADRYDPRVAQTYSNIAFVHFDSNRFDLAIEYFNKEIEVLARIYHSNHLDIAAANKALAICYKLQGDRTQALVCWHKVLNIHIYNFSNAHSTVDEDMMCMTHIAFESDGSDEPEEEST